MVKRDSFLAFAAVVVLALGIVVVVTRGTDSSSTPKQAASSRLSADQTLVIPGFTPVDFSVSQELFAPHPKRHAAHQSDAAPKAAKHSKAAKHTRAKATHAKAEPRRAKAEAKKGPITYTVKRGDNLYDIAQWFHLHGYGALYKWNKKVVGGNPDLIYPGQKITISAAGNSFSK